MVVQQPFGQREHLRGRQVNQVTVLLIDALVGRPPAGLAEFNTGGLKNIMSEKHVVEIARCVTTRGQRGQNLP